MDAGNSPVSFFVSINRLPAKGMPVEIEADEDQRAALAVAHDLLSVESFTAELTVSNWKRDGISVEGRVKAAITQACVVSLEPVTASIDEPVQAVFVPPNSKLAKFEADPSGEMLLDPDGPDAPEVFEGDKLDVGALVEEFFAVAIDPYPRKPGVEDTRFAEQDDAPKGPLAEQLAALKNRL